MGQETMSAAELAAEFRELADDCDETGLEADGGAAMAYRLAADLVETYLVPVSEWRRIGTPREKWAESAGG